MASAKIRPDYVSSLLTTGLNFFLGRFNEQELDVLKYFDSISRYERIYFKDSLPKDSYGNSLDPEMILKPNYSNVDSYFKDNNFILKNRQLEIFDKFTSCFDSFWNDRMIDSQNYYKKNQKLLDKYFQEIYEQVHKIGPLNLEEDIEVCGFYGIGVNSNSGMDNYIFLKDAHIACNHVKFLQLIVHEYAGHNYHEENNNMKEVFGRNLYWADEGLAKLISDKVVNNLLSNNPARCHNHNLPIEISYIVFEKNWDKLNNELSFEEWHKESLLEIKKRYDLERINYSDNK